ncbi:hypothetical protein EJB05_49761, partial [Eragrostis curvula]
MGQAVPLKSQDLPHASSSPQAAMFTALLLLLCPLLFLLRHRFRGRGEEEEILLRKLPSPPQRLPIIPHVSLRDLTAEHGRDGLMLLRLGASPTLVVSSPRAAQAVMRTQDHVFAFRYFRKSALSVESVFLADILFYGSTDVAFSPYGDHWRQVRRIATTHLLTNRKVRSYRHAREREVSSVISAIRDAARDGAAVDLSELLNAFANDVVCHAVCGKLFREEGRNRLFRELVEANSSLIGGFNLEDYFPALAKLDIVKRIVCAKAQKVHRAWDDLLEKLIDGHQNAENKPPADLSSPEDDDDSDFIDVLLSVQQQYSLTRDHIKAQLAIMFEAGTDTSFIVLEYAMVELMQNPHVMTKLRAEVRALTAMALPKDDGVLLVTKDELSSSGVPYLKAVIKETLRLHVPAPLLVPHLSMADCEIQGYTIPAGTRAIVNAWALARDPSHWDRPEEFMPERFIVEEGGSAAAVDHKGNDFLYLPFGTGRRICPGINFAIATIEVMLANLVYHFDWELPQGVTSIDMTESFGLTVHRTEKLLLVPRVPHA